MCGRYSFAPDVQALAKLFEGLDLPEQLEDSFNIAPTQSAYVQTNQDAHQLSRLVWGLVPFYAKIVKSDGRLINARAETLKTVGPFKQPIEHKRCIVPADSFYEWKQLGSKTKQPYRILRKDGALLAFAGLWDECHAPDGTTIRSFTIITTAPNHEMLQLHDRMPAILHTEEERSLWLSDLTADEVIPMLRPAPTDTLAYYPIDRRIGSYQINEPSLHTRVGEPKTLFDD